MTGYRPLGFSDDGFADTWRRLLRDVEDLKRYRAPVINLPEHGAGGGAEAAGTFISGVIPSRAATTGETFLDESLTFAWDGIGTILLSETSSGSGAVLVDDRVILDITHEDGSTATYTYTFGDGETINPAGPLDVTAYFEAGLNQIRVRFVDVFGGVIRARAMWLAVIDGSTAGDTLSVDDSGALVATGVTRLSMGSQLRATSVGAGVVKVDSLGGGSGGRSVGRAVRTTAVSLAWATWANISFQVEERDDASYIDIGAHPTRFTIPADGEYVFRVWPSLAAMAGGSLGVRLNKNGTTVDTHWLPPVNDGGIATKYAVTFQPILLLTGDYIEVGVRQAKTTSGSLNLNAICAEVELWS